MYIRLLLALFIIAALFFFLNWFRNTPAEKVSQALKNLALWSVIILLIALAISGRLHWLVALFASLIPLARRLLPWVRYLPLLNHWRQRYQAQRRASGATPSNQTSQVETGWLRMTLDHDSGEIDGQILAGQFSGQSLSGMTLAQLLSLHDEFSHQDEESMRLLQAYLDHAYGEQWRENIHVDESGSTASGSMTRQEAYEILGLVEQASEQDIVAAHRRLMQKLHPDRGGSTYLAAKINQAKDLLLGG